MEPPKREKRGQQGKEIFEEIMAGWNFATFNENYKSTNPKNSNIKKHDKIDAKVHESQFVQN
jgi:hypothetical protein